jgi:histidinol phosphatase-like PHP family hydrolase
MEKNIVFIIKYIYAYSVYKKGLGAFMSQYKYETHLHTTEASACSKRSAAEQVRFFKDAGYTGIIVTDHFFGGNTNIARNLPWNNRIDLFCKGYENAREEGERLDLSVFFGWEAGFKGTEFLIYGLDKQWLKEHPDILSWSVEEQYRRVHEDGGFVVHAHPFRVRPYIKEIRLFPEFVDAVEVINIGNRNHDFDRQALLYAKKHKLPVTAGTDAHGIEDGLSGVEFPYRLEHIKDFITGIRAGEHVLIK